MQAKEDIDKTTSLEVSVDGRSLKNLWEYRTISPAFVVEFAYGYPITYFDENLVSFPAVSDGFWLKLAPLSAGSHEISIYGEKNDGFVVEVKYKLTVAS
jgi:hypothetical protein